MANAPQHTRLSKAYLLGLSNKPWKDPPRPPPPDSWKGMIGTPGATLEWFASDGRKGALTGTSKSRGLRATLSAAVVAEEQAKTNAGPRSMHGKQTAANSGSKGEVDPGKDMSNPSKGASELEFKRVPNSAWTEEQDKTLFRMKVEQKPWGDITKEIGKDKHECNVRWKEIMPENFYKNQTKGGNKSGDQGDKHDKSKTQRGSKQEQQQQAKSAEPAEPASGDFLGLAGWPGSGEAKSTTSDRASKKDDKGKDDSSANNLWASADATAWNNPAAIDTGDAPGWAAVDNGGGGGDSGGGWPTGNDNNAGDTSNWVSENGGDTWNIDANKDESKEEKGEKKEKKRDDRKQDDRKTTSVSENKWNDASWGNTAGGAVEAKTEWDTNPWGGGDDKGKRDASSSKQSASGNGKHRKSSNTWGNNNGSNAGGTSWKNDNNGPGTTLVWGNENNNNNNSSAAAAAAPAWGDDIRDPPWAAGSEEKERAKDNGIMDIGGWGDKSSAGKDLSKSPLGEKERRSKKHSSHHDSRSEEKQRTRHHSAGVYQSEYKVSPDDTFSQDELKLIARILQQDCSMVWERVSWRFKDKTGRALHPHVFEKKITGRLGKDRKE